MSALYLAAASPRIEHRHNGKQGSAVLEAANLIYKFSSSWPHNFSIHSNSLQEGDDGEPQSPDALIKANSSLAN